MPPAVQRPPLRTVVPAAPHPSGGRGFAYSQDMRALDEFIQQQNLENHPLVERLRQERLYPSQQTSDRHAARQVQEGHRRPYRRTGNNFAEVLRGRSLYYVALFRLLYPKINQNEMNVFLYYCTGRFYESSQISRAEDRLGLTRKVASTTAYQAYFPRNLQLRHNYWTMPYPLGMVGIRRRDIIDIDEFGAFVEQSNRSRGKAVIGKRAREEGPYSHSQRLNVAMAITGDAATPHQHARRWVDMWTEGGTDVHRFLALIDQIIADIGPAVPGGRRRCFTMDNLTAHRHPLVLQAILGAGHRIVFRAPYWSVDGTIEYLFNTLEGGLAVSLYRLYDPDPAVAMENLKRELRRLIRLPADYVAYFEHVGFRYD
jgi:hypothetical protein